MVRWKLLLMVLPVFIVLDLLWISAVMRGFYDQEIGDLGRRRAGALAPCWGAALLVYLLIPSGLVLFVRRLLSGATPAAAFGLGAVFGLVVYGVYDLTNLAVLERWSLRLTLYDVTWGCALCGLVTVAMCAMESWWEL